MGPDTVESALPSQNLGHVSPNKWEQVYASAADTRPLHPYTGTNQHMEVSWRRPKGKTIDWGMRCWGQKHAVWQDGHGVVGLGDDVMQREPGESMISRGEIGFGVSGLPTSPPIFMGL